jgi:hypothetical protein
LAAVVAWAWAALVATAEVVVVAGEEEEKEDEEEEEEEDVPPDFKYFHQPPVMDLLFGRA